MSRWSSHREEQQLDFEALLTQKASGVELLAFPNILDEVKGKSSKFTERIVHPKHRALLNDLIDIALTPRAFTATRHLPLDPIEILSSLSEEFIEQIFDREAEEEDAVVQGEREYPILAQLLRVLGEGEAEETALAYFNKLVTPFIYQRSEQMIRLAPSLLLPALLAHFASHSVADVLTKLLEAENEKEFFEEEKLQLVAALCRSLGEERDEERVARSTESLAGFIESLVEKHEDKYEKTKYARLIHGILERSHTFLFLFALFETQGHRRDTRLQLLRCIEAFLRIHLPAKQSHSKLSEEEGAPEAFPLQPPFAHALQNWLNSHMIHEFVSTTRLELLAYYKLVKTALAVDPALVEPVLTQAFLAETLAFMREDRNNNILHNYQREVLVAGARESERVWRALQEELGLEELFRSSVTERNSTDCYTNQLFLIAEALRDRGQKSQLGSSPGWSQLSSVIDSKRQFYSAVIGGNPRGEDKWDSVDNENDMILRSLNQKDFEGAEKQTIEERLDVEEVPDKKIMIHLASGLEDLGGTEVLSEEEDDPFASNAPASDAKNKHFFDFELPLDSDKEESDPQNQSNSLDDIPLVIKIESNQQSLQLSGGIRTSSVSSGMRNSGQQCVLEVVVEDPLIEQTTQIVIEESFDPLPSRLLYYYRRDEIEASLSGKYGLTLKPAITVPRKEEIERSLLAKYGLTLTTHSNRPLLPAAQEIATLLACKYGLRLKNQ